jgi:DNA polymerase-3 subunit beta
VKLIGKLKDDIIEISFNEEKNEVVIKQGKNKYSFPSEDADDFPTIVSPDTIEDAKVIELEFSDFNEALTDSLGFTTTDTNRPALTGIFLEIDSDSIQMTATDAHRLSSIKVENLPKNELKQSYSYIIPQNIVKVLKSSKFNDEFCSLHFNEKSICLQVGGATLSSNLIDASFPDYRHIIPKDSVGSITVPTEDFNRSIKRLMLLANQTSKSIALVYNSNGIAVCANDLDRTIDGMELLNQDVEVSLSDAGFFGFNANYMSSVVSSLKNKSMELILSSLEGNKALKIIESDDNVERLKIVMPVVLGDFDFKSISQQI